MRDIKHVLVAALAGILIVTAHTEVTCQALRMDIFEIKLIDSEYISEDSRYGYAVVSKYEVDGESLRLVETTFVNDRDLRSVFESRLKAMQKCDPPTSLFYEKVEVGKTYTCREPSGHSILYKFGQRIYEISSKSASALSIFTKRALPISCHLHDSKECVSMYY